MIVNRFIITTVALLLYVSTSSGLNFKSPPDRIFVHGKGSGLQAVQLGVNYSQIALIRDALDEIVAQLTRHDSDSSSSVITKMTNLTEAIEREQSAKATLVEMQQVLDNARSTLDKEKELIQDGSLDFKRRLALLSSELECICDMRTALNKLIDVGKGHFYTTPDQADLAAMFSSSSSSSSNQAHFLLARPYDDHAGLVMRSIEKLETLIMQKRQEVPCLIVFHLASASIPFRFSPSSQLSCKVIFCATTGSP